MKRKMEVLRMVSITGHSSLQRAFIRAMFSIGTKPCLSKQEAKKYHMTSRKIRNIIFGIASINV
jgi:hypothetical protein